MSGIATLLSEGLYQTDTVPGANVGQLAVNSKGDRFRYVKVGGSALVTANCLQEAAQDTQFISMAVPAIVAIGQTAITVTNGTTTVTANQFVGGTLIISTSTGIGQKFYIVSNTAGGSGAAITYNVDRPLLIALSTSSKVSVRPSPFAAVIQSPVTTQTGAAVGFALLASPAASYTWIQSGGETAVLYDNGTATANDQLGIVPSVAVAGSVKLLPAAVGAEFIGYSRQVVTVASTVALAHIIID